jgi:hypothetical protein
MEGGPARTAGAVGPVKGRERAAQGYGKTSPAPGYWFLARLLSPVRFELHAFGKLEHQVTEQFPGDG